MPGGMWIRPAALSCMDWWNQTGTVWIYGPALCLLYERPGLWPEEHHPHSQAWSWGSFFSAAGTGSRVPGVMDARNISPFYRGTNLVDHWTFQQDNDPKHASKSTKPRLRNRSWILDPGSWCVCLKLKLSIDQMSRCFLCSSQSFITPTVAL